MTKEEILNHVNFDIDKAKAIYEWLDGETVSIRRDESGNPIGVRVKTHDEDFTIELHDLDNGKDDYSYDNLMPRLKEIGKKTFTRKQGLVVCQYLDEINDKLKEAGGDEFADHGYLTQDLYIPRNKRSCADYYAHSVWCFGGTNRCFDGNYRSSDHFRCRPTLNLPVSA